MGWFREALGQLALEFPARNKNVSELAAQLERSGNELVEQVGAAQVGSAKNQSKMRHIVGIERWGQHRLRGFLGDEIVIEEYDAYCPESGPDLSEQLSLFREARSKTVHLAIRIESHLASIAKGQESLVDAAPADGADSIEAETDIAHNIVHTVEHNEYGPLTLRGWLRYLEMHARMESKSIK